MRAFVRMVSCLLGLAAASLGGLLVLEVGWHWLWPADAPVLVPWPAWRARLDQLSWTDAPVRIAAVVLVAAGLLLLLAAAGARRRDVRLRDPMNGVSVSTSPRSLARLVGHHVRTQDNVHGADVTATAKRVKVRATSRLEGAAQLRPRLHESVTALLDDVPLAARPRVTVVVDSPKDRK